ncbi:MAG: hypothetical protein LUE91_00405, partial [Oscillospiraceae bacterium]|nr:hypothetical protein [Oscillospiraceae bacterium]
MNDYENTQEQELLPPSPDEEGKNEEEMDLSITEDTEIGPDALKALGSVVGVDKLTELIEHGKKQGRLTSSELLDVLENLDLTSEQMDQIYDIMENLGIDITGDDYLEDVEGSLTEQLPDDEDLDEITK